MHQAQSRKFQTSPQASLTQYPLFLHHWFPVESLPSQELQLQPLARPCRQMRRHVATGWFCFSLRRWKSLPHSWLRETNDMTGFGVEASGSALGLCRNKSGNKKYQVDLTKVFFFHLSLSLSFFYLKTSTPIPTLLNAQVSSVWLDFLCVHVCVCQQTKVDGGSRE